MEKLLLLALLLLSFNIHSSENKSNKDDAHPFPRIKKAYSWYMEKIGNQISDNLYRSYLYMSPKVKKLKDDTLDYYKREHPHTVNFLSDVPAFVKKGYEKMIIRIWQWLYTLDEEELKKAGEDKLVSINMATAAGMALKNPKITTKSKHLNELIDQIRGGAFDYGMSDCYKAVLFEYDILNAFSIGCNIFFSEELYNEVDGDSDMIRAILAHEMAHGDAGHGIKTLFSLIGSGTKYSATLVMEELSWATTGGRREFLDRVLDEGHNMIIMEDFGSSTIATEIEADQRGAKILNRAGFSAKPLIKFLNRVGGEHEDCSKDTKSKSTLRTYPNLCKRIDAIKEVMKF